MFFKIVKKYKKPLLIVIPGFIFLLFIIFIALASSRNLATLEILVTPSSSEISLNNRGYTNGTYEIEPGEYSVIIKKDGFITKKQTILLTAGKKSELHVALEAEDDSIDWYLENNEDDIILNTIGDEEAKKKAEEYVKKYPAISKLPIVYAKYSDDYSVYTEFRIDGGTFEKCPIDFCIKITDETNNSHEKAYEILEEKGINPNDYTIIYEVVTR